MKKIATICLLIFIYSASNAAAQIPVKILAEISRAEDELRFDKTLADLLKNKNEKVRARAALAAGRTGSETAIPVLTNLLENDLSSDVRAAAVFALGEIESAKAANAVLKILEKTNDAETVRARAVEAAGKIAAANQKDEKSKLLGDAIVRALDFENKRRSPAGVETILLGLTAVLRARPAGGETVAAEFLDYGNARVRADAANTLARIRAKNASEKLRALLLSDADAVVRANAARALSAAEDANAFDSVLRAAVSDKDSRVRVSAIRALGSLKNAKAADELLRRGENLFALYKKSKFANPTEKNELLEIAATLGRILPNTKNEKAVKFLDDFIKADLLKSPEILIARLQISGGKFVDDVNVNFEDDWREISVFAQAAGELAKMEATDEESQKNRKEVEELLLGFLIVTSKDETSKLLVAMPDVLRAYANFKSKDLSEALLQTLKFKDVFVRATAAELLGEQPASKENTDALKTAFVQALQTDKIYNDAQLAILSALVKLDKPQSFESLRLALKAPDFLVRRHAAELIKENDLTKDFSNIEKMVGTVKPYNPKTKTKLGQILNSNADYVRAVSRKNAKAIITTEKGSFTIEFTPADAPLTVDNFIKLARSGYFNNVAIHRVVPNFVVQDGDPRGDGNGGPGWQIRDEINMLSYERGMVGMALSGKDTGGSQWFVTHSPQPHLDGGYTIFGRVNETDMKIVDTLVRGDKILSVKIVEGNFPRGTVKERKGK